MKVNVRNAVQKRDDVIAATPDKPSLAAVIRQAIEAQSPAFRAVLPDHVDPDRFSRLTLMAVKSTPRLTKCFETDQGRGSLLIAALQAATIGLEPNTPSQEAWILPRKNDGVDEAELSIGYRGYLKIARRAPNVKTIFAEVVRDNDHFEWARGLESDTLEHSPAPRSRAGELTCVYAVARYHDGGYNFVVLDIEDVHARRAMSESWKSTKARPYSPWTKWEAEMWRKSAVRALVPFLDLTPADSGAVTADERPLTFDDEHGGIVSEYPAVEPYTPQDPPTASPPPDAVGVPPAEEPTVAAGSSAGPPSGAVTSTAEERVAALRTGAKGNGGVTALLKNTHAQTGVHYPTVDGLAANPAHTMTMLDWLESA